ncbi:DUF2281 domain-containing protein [uncultured Nostoc sp.]|uniref:DUF2281 domain-containing protein n=1 Tax=uncultured Nostoc sp. TaxID=340711 RepID=UPI0035CA919F
MTFQTLNLTETLIAKFKSLSSEQQQTLLDFAEFLAQKHTPLQPNQQRVLGLNQGEIWMSEDFNDPLPDEFWMGE